MKNATLTARNCLRSESYFPAELGARHNIISGPRLEKFFQNLGELWGEIVPDYCETEFVTNLEGKLVPEEKRTPRYMLYNDPRKIGMTILEKRLSGQHGRRLRAHWSQQDVGRLKQDICEQIDDVRLGGSFNNLSVTLTEIKPVGEKCGQEPSRKLAALVDPASEAAEFLQQEHEIVVENLQSYFPDLSYPYEHYEPKLTFGRVFKEADADHVAGCVAAAEYLLPVTVELESINLFSGRY